MAEAHLTARQQKWFATVQANLERDTGRSLAEWVAIARTCPETSHRARQAWLKEHYGLMINRASYVLGEAFGSEMPWDDPDALVDALWTDPPSRAIFEAVRAKATALPDVVVGPRKGFTAFSRNFQFAAAKPVKGGTAILGLAVSPDIDAGLVARRKSDPLNERLLAIAPLVSVAEVDGRIEDLLRKAWERS
ncbi:MAG TPA: DUF4287 domain-containing protein [Caulobacteraceae bacterium]|jgi:hypothetical protein|nr:DUF4287 domain-containing protein [Caulobacteraceae bacterium]